MVFLQLSDDRFALAQLSAFANSNQVYSIYEGLTVTELKSAVAERLNAQENSIQLEFNGDLLHNDETLDAYGITDNSTLIISQFLLLVESPDNEEPLSESKSEDEEETEFRSRFINLAKSPVFKKKAKRSLDCSLAEPTIGDSTKSSGQGFRLSYYKELFGTVVRCRCCIQWYRNSSDCIEHENRSIKLEFEFLCSCCHDRFNCAVNRNRHEFAKHNYRRVSKSDRNLKDKMVITEKQVKALSLHSDELHAHRIANPNAVVEFQTANPEKPISAIGPFWLKNQDNEILPIYVDETVEMENSGREASSSEVMDNVPTSIDDDMEIEQTNVSESLPMDEAFYEQLIVEEAHRMRHCELQSLGYLPFTETPLASPRDTSRFLRNPQTPEGSPPASQQLSSSNSSLMVIDEELDYVDKHFERLLSQERNTEQVQRETSAAVEMMETEHSPMSEQISAAIAMPDDSIIDLNIEAEKVATATTTSHSLTSFVTSNSLGPILQQTSSIVNALGANTTTSRSVILNLGVSTLRPTMVTYSSSISLTPISSLPHVTASTESIPLIPTESNEQTDETIEVVDQQDTSDDIEVLDEISFKHTETSVLSPNVATSFSSVEVKPELLLEPIAKSLALHTDSVFYNHAMSSHEFDLIPFAQFATNKSRQLLFVVVKPDEGAMGESTDSWIKPPILQSTYQIFQGPVRSARNTPLQLYILGKTTSDDITKAVTALILSVSWYDQPLKVTEVFELLIGPMNRKFQWKTLVFTSVSERMLLSKSTVAENLVICKLPPGTTSSTQ